MTVPQAMQHLESLGCSFRLDDTGNVKVSFAGGKSPEAAALMEIARKDRAAAADYVRSRQAGAVVVDDGCTYSVLDALAIAQAVKRGDAVLIAPVIFHQDPVNVTVRWEPTKGLAEAVLDWHRERLKATLQGRLEAMEQQALDDLSAENVEALSAKHSLYKALLETKDA